MVDQSRVLVLDVFYRPHRIVPWERAVCLLFDGKAAAVVEYDETIRSPSLTMQKPAVIRMTRAARFGRRPIKFCRENVLTRDGFQCQYCARRLEAHELTYDHVLPRSRGGATHWENIVAACYACNCRKANRTPAEAGMPLLRTPRRPVWLPIVAKRFNIRSMPDLWRPFMGQAA